MPRVPIVLAAAWVICLAGCGAPEMRADLPVQLADYSDVPVPAGMIKDDEHSMRLETPVIGSVVNVYRGGPLGPEALAEHFVQQMPALGWRLLSRFQAQDAILIFEKQGVLCLLGVGNDRGKPTLSVLVGKMGGAAAPPPAQKN
jgi:hypothetical protein